MKTKHEAYSWAFGQQRELCLNGFSLCDKNIKERNTSLWSASTWCMGFVSWHENLVNWRRTQTLLPPYGSRVSLCAGAPALVHIDWSYHTKTGWTKSQSLCSSMNSSLWRQVWNIKIIKRNIYFFFTLNKRSFNHKHTFTCMHLADVFIQSD